jgi:hypothetical protein
MMRGLMGLIDPANNITIISQVQPNSNAAVTLLEPPLKRKFVIAQIIIANCDNVNTVTFNAFADIAGNTFTGATAIACNTPLGPGSFASLEFPRGLGLTAPMSLGGQASVANTVTFTVLGYEVPGVGSV